MSKNILTNLKAANEQHSTY